MYKSVFLIKMYVYLTGLQHEAKQEDGQDEGGEDQEIGRAGILVAV